MRNDGMGDRLLYLGIGDNTSIKSRVVFCTDTLKNKSGYNIKIFYRV